LLPNYAQLPEATVSSSRSVGCVEIGAIPGGALVKKFNNIQSTILFGWGPLIQTKWYRGDNSRAFFGLSSHTDLQLALGYHQKKYFIQIMSEFQFRRINFRQINVQQYYYDVRLFFGYLLGVKNEPKIITDLEGHGLL
jgi:hypothetical protein